MPATKEAPVAAPNNLRHWEVLCKTDPQHTKQFKRAGGFSGTAIKPIWATEQMTRHFGPCGVGWGMDKPEFQLVPAGSETLVYCTVQLWYDEPGRPRAGVVYGVGGDKVVSLRKDGTPQTDDEAFKKAYTDALGNAMKQLGVGADVHMGLFDDSKYKDEVAAEFQAKTNPDAQPEAIAKYESEIEAKVGDCTTLEALDALWKNGTSTRLKDIGLVDRKAQHRIIGYFSKRKNELLARDNPATTAAAAEEDGEQEHQPAGNWFNPASEGQRVQDAIDDSLTLAALKNALEKEGWIPQQPPREGSILARILDVDKGLYDFLIDRANKRRATLSTAPKGRTAPRAAAE